MLPIALLIGLAAIRPLDVRTRPLWLASVDGLAWTMLPFALAGRWGWGLAAVSAYAAGSFVEALRRVIVDQRKR